jgi:Dolichyl-phosphate-mannose-protein mannosyltransferase
MTAGWAVLFCLACGYLLVRIAYPCRRGSVSDGLLQASLAVGNGIGVWSLVFFLGRGLGGGHWLAIDFAVMAGLAAVFWLRRPASRPLQDPASARVRNEVPAWIDRSLKMGFTVALGAAIYSTVLRWMVHPHGEGWDAFAIWNLHARFLFRSDHWRDGLSALIPWSHPDYPLLLPAAIAHFWGVLGKESTWVPAIIGVGFSFATVGLLYAALSVLRGQASALLGGLALLSTPFFVEQGTSQYADVPLSFFFLAVMVLLQLYAHRPLDQPQLGLPWLAGVAAGFAVWTKNEGILYLGATVAAELLVFRFGSRTQVPDVTVSGTCGLEIVPHAKSWRAPALFLAAVSPFLVLVIWSKHSIAFSSELFSEPGGFRAKIFHAARYGAIIHWYAKDFLRFGQWWPVPGTLLLSGLYVLGWRNRSPKTKPMEASFWTLGFTLAGYFAIFVITPYDLYWHLRFSLDRLFLQLWPSAIFLLLLGLTPGWVQKSQNDPHLLKRNAFSPRNSDATP